MRDIKMVIERMLAEMPASHPLYKELVEIADRDRYLAPEVRVVGWREAQTAIDKYLPRSDCAWRDDVIRIWMNK